MPDYGDPGWFQSFELGHQGYSEFLIYWDQDEDTSGVDQFYVETSKMNIKNGSIPPCLDLISRCTSPDRSTGQIIMNGC